MRALLALLLLGGAGCNQGASSLQVTVTSSGVVHGVDRLHVTVRNGGVTAQPIDFTLAGAPVDIPPEQTLTLLFGSDRRGDVSVMVDAQDARQVSLASASAPATISAGRLSTATVTLPGSTSPSYSITGFVSGLGGGVSSGAGFTVEGTIGLPGPRVVSTNGAISVEPLLAGSVP
jgi:hypothetical protein